MVSFEEELRRARRSEADRILEDVGKIRGGLREISLYGHMSTQRAYGKRLVWMSCWNEDEAQKIWSFLSDEERDMVVMTYGRDGRIATGEGLRVLAEING